MSTHVNDVAEKIREALAASMTVSDAVLATPSEDASFPIRDGVWVVCAVGDVRGFLVIVSPISSEDAYRKIDEIGEQGEAR